MIFRGEEAVRYAPAEGIVRRQASCGEKCQIVEFSLEKGAVIPKHSHPNEQIGMVVRGSIALKMGGKMIVLNAGDGYSIASGEVHSVDILEDSVVVDVFAPPREDYKGGQA